MIENLAKTAIENGGSISPLIIPSELTGGTGLCNSSILVKDGEILVNVRHVGYTLLHSIGAKYHRDEGGKFQSRWGPLSYLHPEDDMTLRTTNFICRLNKDLSIKEYHEVDTSKLDKKPVWTFIGLEDGRLVEWNGKLYLCGVRRDTKPDGEGRMELSEIEIHKKYIKEISRVRIQPPIDKDSYCEKNWMPVLDLPYHFVKWANPTEVVKVNPTTKKSHIISSGSKNDVALNNLRGGSQVLKWKDYRICLVHETSYWYFTERGDANKDAIYKHRFLVWDKDWNLIKVSDSFSFMGGQIEFCCGAAFHEGNLLITFGFEDNASFLLSLPETVLDQILELG